MKRVCILLVLFCVAVNGLAQVVIDPKGTKVTLDSSKWKILGNDIYNKNTGNVGIGITNPVYKLDVAAVSDPLRLSGLQNGNFGTDSILVVQNGVVKVTSALGPFVWLQNGNSFGSLGILGTTDNNDVSFITNGGEKMHIDTKGNTFGGGGNNFGKNINNGFIYGIENKVESSGVPSFAFGIGNTIEAADYSLAIGEKNSIMPGTFNFAYGRNNNIPSGNHNYIWGENNTAGKEYLFAYGVETNFNSLNHGFALGYKNKISTFLAMDDANSYFGVSGGNIGIGTSTPTAQLHTTGDVRFEGIGSNILNTNIVTTDASGNVTTRELSSILSGSAITSLNGLTNSIQTFTTGTAGADFNIASTGTTHTFNFPTASVSARGLLSSSNWATFNNKISTVTANTAAAVNTASTTATINNTAAYWNANLLQGRAFNNTAPTTGQVIAWNGTSWTPTAAAPSITTHTLANPTNTITSVVNGVSATATAVNSVVNTSAANNLTTAVNGVVATVVPIINTVVNNLAGSNLTTMVNGIAASAVNLSAIIPATTNAISLSGNTLTSTVNGVAATSNAVATVANTYSANTLTTTVNGVASTGVNIINSNTLTQNGTNQLLSTINGVAATALTANVTGDVTGNLGAAVVSKINGSPLGITTGATSGQALTWNGTAWVPANAAPATITHTLGLSGNTLTSTVNGVTATSNSVATVSNSSAANNLSTTVNGIAGTVVPIINSVSNTSATNTLTTTVNGVASSGVNIINSNALTYVGNILSSTVNGVTSAIPVTVVTAVNNGLTLSGSSAQLGGALTQPTTFTTTASNTLTLAGLQTGTSTDNILVATSGGVIKQIPQVSFPQLLIDVRRTNSYSPTATYSTLVYNTAIINTGTAYNTTTGEFTAPETGIYEIIINNGYNLSSGNVQIVNRINVNGAIDMEKYLSSPKNTTSTTISGNDIVSLTAGQTINITVGGEIGTVTPLVGTGQHVMKIIRLL